MVDCGEAARAGLKGLHNAQVIDLLFSVLMRLSPAARWGFQHAQWTLGIRKPHEWPDAYASFTLKGLESCFRNPMLFLFSEDDIMDAAASTPAIVVGLLDFILSLPCERSVHLFQRREGASSHCQMGGLSYAHTVIFTGPILTACASILELQYHFLEEHIRMSEVTDFDFLLGSWTIHNRRRTNPFAPPNEGTWEEFLAVSTSAKQLDGRARVEQYEATFPDGQRVLGLTIRAFDQATKQWSIIWLDTRNPPDFRPLVGHFEQGVGLFYQVIDSPIDGKPVHVRFTWDQITANSARWQQAFSFDGGTTWETNWIMDHRRRE